MYVKRQPVFSDYDLISMWLDVELLLFLKLK
jgi:hypothetical protein